MCLDSAIICDFWPKGPHSGVLAPSRVASTRLLALVALPQIQHFGLFSAGLPHIQDAWLRLTCWTVITGKIGLVPARSAQAAHARER